MALQHVEINKLETLTLPVIPLRGLVLYPKIMLQFDVGRKKSLIALNEAMKNNQKIFLVPQKNIADNNPTFSQMCNVGVVATTKQIIKQQNGKSVRVLAQGEYRAKIDDVVQTAPHMIANVTQCKEIRIDNITKQEALMNEIRNVFADYLTLSPQMAPDVIIGVQSIKNPSYFSDYISSNIMLKTEDEQELLCELDPLKRLEKLLVCLSKEIDILKIENKINIKVKKQIDKNQRDYFLREQIKAISEELGEDDDPKTEAEEYRKKVQSLKADEIVKEKLFKECDKLYKMPLGSHEANVVRNYLDTCLSLPWGIKTKTSIDIAKAKRILNKEHYGLDKVKERILEALAVRKMSDQVTGQILCFVGPPGVGKTSIVKSIAKAVGMNYVRLSLGGIKDESEIRGHRRTYIGSMPGRIIDAINQAKSCNPLILLDEIDKLSNDFRGDPTSALLEVLDPEQNSTFVDHYIDMPFNLSDTIFITTANDASSIPAPLYDRMEVIDLVGYTPNEKFNIAKKHLIPKQMKNHGLTKEQVRITDKAIKELIDGYTREAGVRNLERTIAKLFRKTDKMIVSNEITDIRINEKILVEMLGNRKFKKEELNKNDEVGVVNGLAWTSVGGEVMPIEAAVMDGTGHIELTGSLGDVMKESAKAAISCIRTRSNELKIDPLFYKNKDIHIHVPEGAVPKDGPSAGITMATAIASALTGRTIKHGLAMTGEITLRGRVLPIGGLKEKTMAAYMNNVKTVIIPKDNEIDLDDIDKVVRKEVEFITVDKIDSVLDLALNKSVLAQKKTVSKSKKVIPPEIIPKKEIRPMV